jgi:hypothetical protein
MRALVAVLAITLILAVSLVSAGSPYRNFMDDVKADFDQGTHNQTAGVGTNLTLANASSTAYHTSGNYTSKTFDAGTVVSWTMVSANYTAGGGHNYTVRCRFSNDTSSWTSWTALSPGSGNNLVATPFFNARYGQYSVFLSTSDTYSAPSIDYVGLSVVGGPLVTLSSPANNHVSTTGSINFSCSAVSAFDEVKNITFYWNYSGVWAANETVSTSGSSASATFQKTGLDEKAVIWACMSQDSAGYEGFTNNRTASVSFPGDTSPPSMSYTLQPSIVRTGGTVEMKINASDTSGVDRVWVILTLPSGSNQTLELQNSLPTNYTTLLAGQYRAFFFANDTLGYTASASGSFTAQELEMFNASVVDSTGLGTPANLTLYYTGTTTLVDKWYSATGKFTNRAVVSGIYDFMFESVGGNMKVLLRNIDTGTDDDSSIGMDMLSVPAEGYSMTYSIDSNYTSSSSKVTLLYNETAFDSEDALEVYACTTWDFMNRTCGSTWSKVTSTQDTSKNTLDVPLTSLDTIGLSVRQGGFCGDGTCGTGENANSCPADCECIEDATRACGTTDTGPCQFGLQTCLAGSWGPCIGSVEPSSETCNGVDDDCDGIIDNINNGTSVLETGCQCYGGGQSAEESCNGLDDDCDGQIDEGLQRRSGTDVGICQFSISTCVNGMWSEPVGGVEPQDETCGNSLDDDCDGTADEGCDTCFNLALDPGEEGVDCGGICPSECPPPFPWTTAAIIAVAVIAIALVGYYFFTRMKPVTWEELEDKYGKPQGKGEKAKDSAWRELEEKYKNKY